MGHNSPKAGFRAKEQRFLYLGGAGSSWSFRSTNFEEIAPDEALEQKLSEAFRGLPGVARLGLVSYDDYAIGTGLSSRWFDIKGWQVRDEVTGACFSEGEHAEQADAFQVARKVAKGALPPWPSLKALDDKASYLRSIERIRDQIRLGRYYQLNFLRYFQFDQWPCPDAWYQRFEQHAGPYGAMLFAKDIELISFSPERFIAVEVRPDGHMGINTFPIKGTAAAAKDPRADEGIKAALASSAKDRSELAMIIDLMRHDLSSVSKIGTTQVVKAFGLRSFRHVHHLEGHVTGILKPELTLGELLQGVCPAGSITGAPKKEVIKAIAEIEGEQRGYFMGNIFLIDPNRQRIDSSVLIRTAYNRGACDAHFAAGGGIVYASDPSEEYDETVAKARVVT